ncbi:sulfatase-like hydrolase/transferase [Stieleria varia]|uniref:Inner membrane protein YejM n=1 Tax=Stieleria varia TaxID=2528005 RepID=A0A5C6BB30_9BACT|nr:sulfatase-like hydrolase/transferase [Stieleria varia]TWU08479.1 Inner membrane protein YejM [Stieleria varia]
MNADAEDNRWDSAHALHSLTLWAAWCCAATWAICRFSPYGDVEAAFQAGFPFADAWIVFRAGVLCLVAMGLAEFLQRSLRIRLYLLAAVAILAIPMLVFANSVLVSWVGRSLFDAETWDHAWNHGGELAGHIPSGAIRLFAMAIVGGLVFSIVGGWGACRLGRRWRENAPRVWPIFVGAIMVSVSGLLGIPAWTHRVPEIASRADELMVPPAGVSVEMARRIEAMDMRHRQVTVTAKPQSCRDIVVVVIESFRPELVTPDVMPNLAALAQRSVVCRNHFSGGNATTHGMFSLLNGLSAVWYSRPVRTAPIGLRLFREAGYELGFFGGHDDWEKFRMTGFINRATFDVMETQSMNWLTTDRQATERAAVFLNADKASRRPRMAVLYLYSTHADYRSYASDQVFQPAADDRYLIPYTNSMRPLVWNRYKNSARSVDRLLAGVLDDERIVAVVGDHGESFLEDGVCGHGTKLNRYQNMTPAVIYCPRQTPQQVDAVTGHADVLPTILGAAGIIVSDPEAMDGVNLLDASERDVRDRVTVTRNYLDDQYLLVPGNVSDREPMIGHRVELTLNEWQASVLETMFLSSNDPSEPDGEAGGVSDGAAVLQEWIEKRLPRVVERD